MTEKFPAYLKTVGRHKIICVC